MSPGPMTDTIPKEPGKIIITPTISSVVLLALGDLMPDKPA